MVYSAGEVTGSDFESLGPNEHIDAESDGYTLLGAVQISVRNGQWMENFTKAADGSIIHFCANGSNIDRRGTVVSIERALEIVT